MTKVAYKNATLLPVDSEPIASGTLLVANGKIVGIGKDLDTTGYEVIELDKKQYITPGLIDAHTHTGIWGEGSGMYPNDNDGNEHLEAITPYVRVLDAIHPEDVGFLDARKAGVTICGITHGSANPIGGQACAVKSVGTIADEMIIKEPTGIKMALGENPKRTGQNNKRLPTTRMGVAYLIRKALIETQQYKKKWDRYNFKIENEEVGDEPEFDLGKEALVKVLKREIPIRCHAHRADDIITAIRLSKEFGYRLVIDHATESYKVKEFIAANNIPVMIGPMIGGRAKRELNDQSYATPGIMHKAGVKVSLMTDSPFNPIHSLRDLMLLAIRHGLPQIDALRTITLHPAEVLGVNDRVGTLTAGKDADFVIFDGDPHLSNTKVLATYIDGKQVYARPDYLNQDIYYDPKDPEFTSSHDRFKKVNTE